MPNSDSSNACSLFRLWRRIWRCRDFRLPAEIVGRFRYRRVDDDVQLAKSATGFRHINDQPVYDAVLKIYWDQKAYSPIVTYLVENYSHPHACAPIIRDATKALVGEGALLEARRLWDGIIAKHRMGYRQLVPLAKRRYMDSPRLLEVQKRLLLDDQAQIEAIYTEMGDREAVETLRKELGRLLGKSAAEAEKSSRARQMTEDVFWEMIVIAHRRGDTHAAQCETVVEELERCSGPAIQRFAGILAEKMALAYRADLWALAYLAGDGCSDDAFLGFRAWLILQGRSVFEETIRDVRSLFSRVLKGPLPEAPELLSAPEIAYEAQTGSPLPAVERTPIQVIGMLWKEDEELEVLYPDIVAHYEGRKGNRA